MSLRHEPAQPHGGPTDTLLMNGGSLTMWRPRDETSRQLGAPSGSNSMTPPSCAVSGHAHTRSGATDGWSSASGHAVTLASLAGGGASPPGSL